MSRLHYLVASAAVASLTLMNPAFAVPVVSDVLNIMGPTGLLVESLVAPVVPRNEGGHAYQAAVPSNVLAAPIVLTEPDGSISDIIGIFTNNTFGFLSDHVDGRPLTPSDLVNNFLHAPGATFQPETVGFIDVSLFIDPGLRANGFTAQFASDFEVATPIPAALPLFATGLGVMGFLARRRKRKATAAVAA